MTDILFVSPNLRTSVKDETNGIMILGTILLQNNFTVDIIRHSEIEDYYKDYGRFVQNLTNAILEKSPRIVSLYTITINFHIAVRLASELKKRDSSITVVLGGPYASLLPVEILECAPEVDYVCVGEGETTIVSFVSSILNGDFDTLYNVPGLCYRKDGQIIRNPAPAQLEDLDSVPMWDDRLYLDSYIVDDTLAMSLEVGRGCPFRCKFCSTSICWERNYRLKSPKRVLSDILYFYNRFGYKKYVLCHDALTADVKRMEQLCDEIIKADLGLRLGCSSRADCLPPKLIDKMQKAGFVHLQIGVETGSERMQKIVNKNLDLAKVRETVKVLLERGFNPQLFFIYGFPEETPQDLNDTLNMVFDFNDMGARSADLRFYKFAPKTEMCEQFIDQLYCDEELLKRDSVRYFGLYEEQDMVRNNKKMFTNLYNMHTQVRDEYVGVINLHSLYLRFPKSAPRIRKMLYKNDCLKMFHDYEAHNPQLQGLSRAALTAAFKRDDLQIMLRTIKEFKSLKALWIRWMLRAEKRQIHRKANPPIKRIIRFSKRVVKKILKIK